MLEFPVIEVDVASPVPAYRQIADAVRAHLVAGRLPPGSRLPTVRTTAIELGLNHNTVAEAYRILADEGWLELGRGRGATVRERPSVPASPEARARFERRLIELSAEARGAGVSARAICQALVALARTIAREGRRA